MNERVKRLGHVLLSPYSSLALAVWLLALSAPATAATLIYTFEITADRNARSSPDVLITTDPNGDIRSQMSGGRVLVNVYTDLYGHGGVEAFAATMDFSTLTVGGLNRVRSEAGDYGLTYSDRFPGELARIDYEAKYMEFAGPKEAQLALHLLDGGMLFSGSFGDVPSGPRSLGRLVEERYQCSRSANICALYPRRYSQFSHSLEAGYLDDQTSDLLTVQTGPSEFRYFDFISGNSTDDYWDNFPQSPMNVGGDFQRFVFQYSVTGVSVPRGLPEPAEWGLMVLGFAVAGYALRRSAGLARANMRRAETVRGADE